MNQNAGLVVSVVRKTFPALKASVIRDFVEILSNEGIYRENLHNKSDHTYNLFGNLFEFFSLDQAQKVRGRKRDVLYCNEANEITREDWRQLVFRTTSKKIIDYNPSEPFHWIYDDLVPREDAVLFKSTYKDNPHLSPTIVAEIERLKETDPDAWAVYGLGERATNRRAVYKAERYNGEEKGKLVGYGLDFGFANDPTALVAMWQNGNTLTIEQKIHQKGMTNQDISVELARLGVRSTDTIICDSSEPKSIEELHRLGWNVKPVNKKGQKIDRDNFGIQLLRSHNLLYLGDDLEKEFQNYRYKEDKNGEVLNVPEDNWNHLLDAARYAAMELVHKKYNGKYFIS